MLEDQQTCLIWCSPPNNHEFAPGRNTECSSTLKTNKRTCLIVRLGHNRAYIIHSGGASYVIPLVNQYVYASSIWTMAYFLFEISSSSKQLGLYNATSVFINSYFQCTSFLGVAEEMSKNRSILESLDWMLLAPSTNSQKLIKLQSH